MRKEVPLIILFLAGLVVMFSRWTVWGDKLGMIKITDKFDITISAAALLLGALNLSRIHVNNIRRRRSGYFFSILLLACLWPYFVLGVIQGYNGKDFRWIYNNLVMQMDSTIFSLLCFYIASAAYRAFRVRTREATVLMVAAAIVMLGKAPLGEKIWAGFGDWGNWIMRIPNTAAMRGILLGAGLGGFVTALRILLGIERAHLSGVGAGGMQ